MFKNTRTTFLNFAAFVASLLAIRCNPMINRFDGPRLKVERAKAHIIELRDHIQSYWSRHPYTIHGEPDPATGETVYIVRTNEQIPCDWGVIIGDIVHNLRAALDQMVCCLVEAHGQKRVTRSSGFLITGSKQTFEAHFEKKVDGISPRANRIIRRFKPYHRGDGDKLGCSILFWLDTLDDLDKHKGIIPVAAAQVNSAITLTPTHITETAEGGFFEWTGGATFNSVKVPLEDGAELMRIGPSEHHAQPQFTLTITVAEAAPFAGKAVYDILRKAAKFIEKGIGILERHAT